MCYLYCPSAQAHKQVPNKYRREGWREGYWRGRNEGKKEEGKKVMMPHGGYEKSIM